MTDVVLRVRQLQVSYPIRAAFPWQAGSELHAVQDVNFDLVAGSALGIVGESGCGKSSLARAICGLTPISGGAVELLGHSLQQLDEKRWRPLRQHVQMVFQDPLASLNPRMTIGENIAEPLINLFPDMGKEERQQRVLTVMGRVGLSETQINRYPNEFSGGQCQRAGIARALISEPKILVCDEPVSALDVSIQAQILNLLDDLRRELQLAILFIAHDLAVVRHLCDDVLVMYLGRVMERARCRDLFKDPAHPYTRALMASVPRPKVDWMEQRGMKLEGDLPSPSHPPSGCVFRSRCPMAENQCAGEKPRLRRINEASHAAACLFAGPRSAS